MCFPSPFLVTFLLACSFTLRNQSQMIASASQIYLALSSTTSKDTVGQSKARQILSLTLCKVKHGSDRECRLVDQEQGHRSRSSRSGGCWTKFQRTKPSHKHKMWVWLKHLQDLLTSAKSNRECRLVDQEQGHGNRSSMSGGCWTKFQHTKPSHKHKMWVLLQCMIFREQAIASYC